MKKLSKKEIFSIPNLMSYFRIIMIPVICWMYFRADCAADYLWAGLVVAISSITDLFDGLIARKFNMVTDLGKILDPVADKLTHAALAICVAFKFPLMWALIALMAVKEGYMAVMGMRYLKKGSMLNGAMWFGKICTTCLFVGLLVLFLFPGMNPAVADGIIIFMMLIMLITFIMYIFEYSKIRKGQAGEEVEKL